MSENKMIGLILMVGIAYITYFTAVLEIGSVIRAPFTVGLFFVVAPGFAAGYYFYKKY